MTPLPYLSVLKISGADAEKFLQGQVAAQLLGLTAPDATFAAYCSPKGKVIATVLLAPRVDYWLMVVESSLLDVVKGRLQQFILREDVTLEPMPDYHLFIVEYHDIIISRVILMKLRNLPISYSVTDEKPLVIPEATTLWRRKELLYGIPWLNAASSEKYIPQMLGLDRIGAVSFRKGCYPGQEVVARARHLGEVKRKPLVLDLTGPTVPQIDLPTFILAQGRRVEADIVHCVTTGKTSFTVFVVTAYEPVGSLMELEQNGQYWEFQVADATQENGY